MYGASLQLSFQQGGDGDRDSVESLVVYLTRKILEEDLSQKRK